MSAFLRPLLVAALLVSGSAALADPPRFTEEREAAALYFVRKHCPDLLPLLDDLKKSNRTAYELQVRETFRVTELLADLQDDPKRHELELKTWKAENQALVLAATLAGAKDEDRKAAEEQLQAVAKELVELDALLLEYRAEVLQGELAATKDELVKLRENFDRLVRERLDSILEKSRKKKP